MCGIIAIKGKDSIRRCVDGLKSLEYRGYDSCGIAFKKNDIIGCEKVIGYVSELEKATSKNEYDGLVIGHTRWATHGGVSIENTHPHLSFGGKFAIVHNGIIENYLELKEKYLSGISMVGQTDSEVVAHLVEKFYEGDILNAFYSAVSLLKGSFAIAMISTTEDKIYFAKNKSPLYLCRNDSDFVLCSDVGCLKGEYEIYTVEDNEFGFVGKNIAVYDKNHKLKDVLFAVAKAEDKVEATEDIHYMLKEIREIPNAIRRSFEYLQGCRIILPKEISRVLIVGCGTSFHSGLIGSKYIEKISKIKCECMIASEFIYNDYLAEEDTLAIFVSQSGETADTLSAIERAKEMGMYTLSIVNVELSTMARMSDEVLYMKAGREVCVASTKAYTTQVFYFLFIANILRNIKENNFEIDDKNVIVCGVGKNHTGIEFDEIKKLFELSISDFERIAYDIADTLYYHQDIHLIGKDYDYLLSQEGALKIKEVSYIFTSAYPSGELKHGTLALIDENSVVISLNTQLGLLSKGLNGIQEIVARGGRVIVVSQHKGFNLKNCEVLSLPDFSELLMPIVAIIPIDLIAYFISIKKGLNPDRPRNLAKSVTVE